MRAVYDRVKTHVMFPLLYNSYVYLWVLSLFLYGWFKRYLSPQSHNLFDSTTTSILIYMVLLRLKTLLSKKMKSQIKLAKLDF